MPQVGLCRMGSAGRLNQIDESDGGIFRAVRRIGCSASLGLHSDMSGMADSQLGRYRPSEDRGIRHLQTIGIPQGNGLASTFPASEQRPMP
jgi:hypothetical protein